MTRMLEDHAARRLETWQAAFSRPPGERIGPAPPELVDYLVLDNAHNGIADRPRTAKLAADLLADVEAAIAGLPAMIWKLIGERLAGIHFVDGLGGTGYSDYVRDRNGRQVAAFVVLDASVLARQSANAWATWKETTPFTPDASHRLDARIATDAADDRKGAIQYILLHELGHVLSVGTDAHPPWNLRPKDVAPDTRYPFFDLSWTVDRAADVYRSRFDAAFPQRMHTVYYFGAKLPAAAMLPAYRNLRETNFPSLYAATHPADDFAEAFASYVHVVLMGRPWQVTITQDGAEAAAFTSCWEEPRCAQKRRYLERMIDQAR